MMRVLPLLFVTLLVTAPALAQMPPGPREALDGVDPVALLTTGKEVSGKPELKVTRGKFEYLFATAENKAAFEKAPEQYEIQLSGACARMGGGVTGNPSDYAVVDGRIYIFGSDDCRKKFVAAPEKFLPKPAAPMPSSAEAVRAGRALLDKAVEAVGGAARVDAVTSYIETTSQDQKRPAGDVRVTTKTIRRFPEDLRIERSMTGRPQATANIITPSGSWFVAQGRAFPQSSEGRAASMEEYNRQLLPLLRHRSSPSLEAAALPSAKIGDVEVDRVRLKNGGVDVTLNLVKGQARIHSMTFVGRGLDSDLGDYAIVFDDFRDVNGLRLPFAEHAHFNGAPDTFRTRRIDSLEINPAIDPALFAPPSGGGQ